MVGGESIRSGNVLVQSTHPGPQLHLQVLVSELSVVTWSQVGLLQLSQKHGL